MRSTVTRREGPEITSARSGVPTHSVGRASDRGTPAVARQHRAPPGSRTTTVLPPRRERPRNRPHEIGGCRPRREGPRNRPHQIGGAGGGSVPHPRGAVARRACAWRSMFWRPKLRPEKSPPRPTTSRRCIGASRCRAHRRSLSICREGPRNRPHQIGGAGGGSVTTPPERVPGEHAPGARYFGRPKPRPEKSPPRRSTSRRCIGASRRRPALALGLGERADEITEWP
jgi:hypothetical protein